MYRLFVCLTLLILFSPAAAAGESQPNVIFILLDDMGWGDFGTFFQNESNHAKRHQTPMLDRMAKEGMQLRAHYCPAPVCAPSRSSLLSGVHQGHAQVRDNQFDKALADNHTLATVMKAAGYKTWIVGKYGLQGGDRSWGDSGTPEKWSAYPTKRGFDEFYGYVRHRDGHVHYPADPWPLGDSESHRSPKQVWHNDHEVSNDLATCYTTDLFTARSKDWIIKHTQSKSEEPFFLYLAYDTPHAALQLPSTAYPDGSGLDGGLQWTGEPGRMINTATGEIDSYRYPDYVDRGWSDVEERFATMVRRIDTAIGDLLQTLRDLEIDDETLVVLSCDNGPHHESYLRNQDGKRVNYTPQSFQSYGPYDGTKRDVWEGGIRVGTLAWWPGNIAPGSVDNTPSQFHDWMPTFARAAGIVPPARSDGVSLLPRLTGQGTQRPSQIYIEYVQSGRTPSYQDFEPRKRGKKRGQMQVVFVDGYKGVRTNIQSHDTPFAIYNLKNDPKELNDLADSGSRFEELQQRMKDQVLRMRRPNESAKRPYDKSPIPAVELDPTTPWTYEFYEGDFPYVPQVSELEPNRVGTIGAMPPQLGKGALRIRGVHEVASTAAYEVVLTASKPAFARVHDAELIDADFGFDPDRRYSTIIRLEKGTHPICLTVLCDGAAEWKLDFNVIP